MAVVGPRDEELKLVTIDQPNRVFRVGENVEVLCRANSRDTRVEWEHYANQQKQYVQSDVSISFKALLFNLTFKSFLQFQALWINRRDLSNSCYL